MKLSLTYTEISDYIKSQYDKTITLSKVSEYEARISYHQKVLLKTIQVPVNILIDNVTADSVALTYSSSFGIDMIIKGMLSFLKTKIPEISDFITIEGHHVLIELYRLNKAKPALDALSLTDIRFQEDSICISASLK